MSKTKRIHSLFILAIVHILIAIAVVILNSNLFEQAIQNESYRTIIYFVSLLPSITFFIALIYIKLIKSTKETNWLYNALITFQGISMLVASYCFFAKIFLLPETIKEINETIVIFLPVIFATIIISKEKKLNLMILGALISNILWIIGFKFISIPLVPSVTYSRVYLLYIRYFNHSIDILWAIGAIIMYLKQKPKNKNS